MLAQLGFYCSQNLLTAFCDAVDLIATMILSNYCLLFKQIDSKLEEEMKKQANEQVNNERDKAINKAWDELQYEVLQFDTAAHVYI